MTTKVRTQRIKEEEKPVDLRHKNIVKIVVAPRRFLNESQTNVVFQGTMHLRDDMASRMDEAVGRESVGQKMARGFMSRYGDEVFDDDNGDDDDDDYTGREPKRRKLLESSSHNQADDDDEDDGPEVEDYSRYLDNNDDNKDDDDSGMDDEDDGDMDEEALRKKAKKIKIVHFKMIAPTNHFPFIAPCFRYKCEFKKSVTPKFPPDYHDLNIKDFERLREEYTWTSFMNAVVKFAPFIVNDSFAKQYASGRVGTNKKPFTKISDFVRIQSRTFRTTAALIFGNAFRPHEYYKLYYLIPEDERNTITDDKVMQIWKDIAIDGHLHEYLFPLNSTPFDADWLQTHVKKFKGINLAITRWKNQERRRRNILDEDNDDDEETLEHPLSDYIIEANELWQFWMKKSLDGAYVWNLLDFPGEYTPNKRRAYILEEKKVLTMLDRGIYISEAMKEMIIDISFFCVKYKDNIITGTGRGMNMDEVIIDSYVRDNTPYPTDPNKRYIMCPTRSHALTAGKCCGYIPVNLGDLDRVRQQIRTTVLPVAELIVLDGAHLYGIKTMHFIMTKIHEALCVRPRPFKLFIVGAPLNVLGKTHADKWPVFIDILGKFGLQHVSSLPTLMSDDLRGTLGKNPGFPIDSSGKALMKVVLYDDSATPSWETLPRKKAWKWLATSTPATASLLGNLIIRYRDAVREKGSDPLILFDYYNTMQAVMSHVALGHTKLTRHTPVIGQDGGQYTLENLYEIRHDRTTSRIDTDIADIIHPMFITYKFVQDNPCARRSLHYEPICPLSPTTLKTCRYTPSKYVIFVTGAKNFRKEDLIAAAYYTTHRLFIIAPKSAGVDFNISSPPSKPGMFDIWDAPSY